MAGGISGRTRLCGILGHPLDHTLSPRMHNAAFAALGLDWAYVPWPVPPGRLAEAVRGLRALDNFAGANVTVPHKEAVIPLLEDLTEEARAVGAVNTIVRAGDRLTGHTTDGVGLLAALAETAGLRPEGMRVVIIGAGGAGRSAAFALAGGGARELALVNRSEARARAVAADVARRSQGVKAVAYQLQSLQELPVAARILGDADLVVNATSVGMRPGDPCPVELAACPPHAFAFDMIYGPPETPFLRQARACGLRGANGLSMLLHQGAAAFTLWTGRAVPVETFRKALEAGETA